jgi:hypothetical protein
MVPGWMPLAGFREVLGLVSGGQLVETAPAKTAETVADYIRRYGRVTDWEVTVTFDLSDEEWTTLRSSVLSQEGLPVESAGNGRFLRGRSAAASGTCDPATGACTV